MAENLEEHRNPLHVHDERLLDLLAMDGRAPSAWLASSVAWHESTIRRRIAELRRGSVHFEMDIDPGVSAVTAPAMLWASIVPAQLDTVGTVRARHLEVPFVLATTGSTDLMAMLVCHDTGDLHT